MNISPNTHLSYCTNIHPGEHWADVWQSLKDYSLPLKKNLNPDQEFGIGLRLSNTASEEILEGNQLQEFKDWLDKEGLYVFTFNGFPYGGFHRTHVKDDVHKPDWTREERLAYTIRLFDILSFLLPEGMEGGISTSPLSYRHWYKNDPQGLEKAWETGILNFSRLAIHLHKIYQEKGQLLHVDIEPEPDGLLENTQEVLDFYAHRLIPLGGQFLAKELGISLEEAETILRRHIQICYDVCHFAVVYEKPADTFLQWNEAGIKIGKVQISAALKAEFPGAPNERVKIEKAFEGLNESTYLHQVVARNADGNLAHYNDLPEALNHIKDEGVAEWRTHFHVPIFIDQYDVLRSTRSTIEEVLQYEGYVSDHWEVETYTWEVLPKEIRFDLGASIERELQWVMDNWKQNA
ncbi:MAG: metabolite traffic protein EboE [Bacteroidota bacterium]